MSDAVYELRRAVDTLTVEHDEVVEDREGNLKGVRREKPLLVKLRAAVASNIGGSGSGKPGYERVPINVGACDLLKRIAAEITDWYETETDRGVDGRPAPEVVLRKWFVLFAARSRGESMEALVTERVREVRSWVTQIRDLLDPPHRFELTSPCPVCGNEWAEVRVSDDPNEVERVRVLNGVERERVEESYVLCRSCDTVWRGLDEAQTLFDAIAKAEALTR